MRTRLASLILVVTVLLLLISSSVTYGVGLSQQLYSFLRTVLSKKCTISKIEVEPLSSAVNVTGYGYKITVIAGECEKVPPVCTEIYVDNRSVVVCNFRIRQNIEPIITNASRKILVLALVGVNPATPPVQYVYRPHLVDNILKLYTIKNLDSLIIVTPSNYSLYYCTGLRIVHEGDYGKYGLYLLKPYGTLEGKIVTCGLIEKYSVTYRAMLVLEYFKLALVCGLAAMCICAAIILRRR